MRKALSMFLCALLMTTAFAFFGANAAIAEGSPVGEANCFEVTNSTYLDVTLCSSEVVVVTLESIPRIVSFTIEATASAPSTSISMSGFEPGRTYYRHEDGYLIESFVADEEGNYSYIQDLSRPHHVFIQEEASTKFIRDDATGGDCYLIGTWDFLAKTCMLTSDVFEMIVIDANGITLDGDGHSVTYGTGSYGIYASGRSGMMIENVAVSGFAFGIYLSSSNGNTISGNTVSDNRYGIYLRSSSSNTVSENTVSGNTRGIRLISSSSNTVSENTISGNDGGIKVDKSSSNTISGNTVSGSSSWGIYQRKSSSNIISGNTVSGSGSNGIDVRGSSSNTISGNTVSGNGGNGIRLYKSSSNTIFHNNIIDNTNQLYNSQSTNTWDNGAGDGNYWSDYAGADDGSGGRLACDGVGDTDLPHQGVDWYPLMSPWSPDPVDAIVRLKAFVEGQDIPHGIKNSLISQLNAAENALSNGQENAAVNILNAFIHHVEALRSADKLTQEQAEHMISSAQAIIETIEGGQGD